MKRCVRENLKTPGKTFRHEVFQNFLEKSSIKNLIKDEKIYMVKNPTKNCKHASSEMRAYLIHWLMEVCSDFTFRRETFHYIVNYIDRFLKKDRYVRQEDL